MTGQPCRPHDLLIAAGRLYPRAWRIFDEAHGTRDWPDWCYAPLSAGVRAVRTGASRPDLAAGALDAPRLTALGAWRFTQGIYRFDPAVYEAVRDTSVNGDIPRDILYRLPEWCIYVETPGLSLDSAPIHGFFAHLDHDGRRDWLRLLVDTEWTMLPIPIELGDWPLAQSIESLLGSANRAAAAQGIKLAVPASEAPGGMMRIVEPMVSLLLYLCSQAGEIGDGTRRPSNPEPTRTRRHGWKIFPAERPYTWDVGVRLGAALRRAYAADQTGQVAENRERPRAHIRRAHWHGFWIGPRDGPRKFDLRWLPPIPVNVDDGAELPAVVRRVT